MNLPNLITLSRLALTPVFFVVFFLCHQPSAGAVEGALATKIAVLAIAISFELSDVLDGYLARRLGLTTDLGKVIDPLADSFSRFTVFVCFLWAGYAYLWMVLVIFWRDCLVASLRGIAARQGIAMGARISGKIKAIVQGGAIITITGMDVVAEVALPEVDVSAFAVTAMTVVAVVTAISLCDYVYGSRGLLRTLFENRPD